MRTDLGSALVSGGASGLGLATVRLLAERGYRVTAADLPTADRSGLAAVAGSVRFVPTDVTDVDDVRQAVREAVDDGPLRVAVCCAGIADTHRVIGRAGPMAVADFDRVVRVNLTGSAAVLIEAAAAMASNAAPEDADNGVIVLTASIATFDGGSIAYSAAKAGVAGMTLPAAQSLAGHRIRVMSIAPGFFDTPMLNGMPEVLQRQEGSAHYPQRRGAGSEFAQLVGDIIDNPMLNGECIRLDAAFRMWSAGRPA